MWYCGVAWPAAALGVATFRGISLLLPLPFALAVLPRLRAIGAKADDTPEEGTTEDEGEPALQH